MSWLYDTIFDLNNCIPQIAYHIIAHEPGQNERTNENQNPAWKPEQGGSEVSVIYIYASYPRYASTGIWPESSVKTRVQRENQNQEVS